MAADQQAINFALNNRPAVAGSLEIKRLDKHHNRLHLFLRRQFMETLPRLDRRTWVSDPWRRINFRHVIESLRSKPRALMRA